MLRELDCDEAQGYHMGRPMPAVEFVAWSAAWLERNPSRLAPASNILFH
jgi:EAL domain-containing protein (putative c-di-GMP-specific phosphodiesterase class I)